jgi:hypothetical protein
LLEKRLRMSFERFNCPCELSHLITQGSGKSRKLSCVPVGSWLKGLSSRSVVRLGDLFSQRGGLPCRLLFAAWL